MITKSNFLFFSLVVSLMFTAQIVNSQACVGSSITLTVRNLVPISETQFTFEVWAENTNPIISQRLSAIAGNVGHPILVTNLGTGWTAIVLEQPLQGLAGLSPITPNIAQTTAFRWTNNPNPNSTLMLTSDVKVVKFQVTLGSGGVMPTALNLRYTSPSGVSAYCNGNPNVYTMNSLATGLNFGSNAPLPVKLTDFSAEKVGERKARLTWSSSSEINSSHFEIEKSHDADNFEKIGEVKAAGNSQTLLRYEFYDDKIEGLRSKQILYYRLKMVDLDGTIEYTDIRGLNFGNDQSFGVSMYPNPTSQFLNLDISKGSSEEKGELQVFDALGKLILSKKVIGTGIETIDMGRMSNGVYHVVLTQGDHVFKEKIIKID